MHTLTHSDLLVVDGLQINNWDRKVLEELRAGGVTGVNATCAVWDGPTDTLGAVAQWYQLAADNKDIVTLAETSEDIRAAKRDNRIAVLLGFQNSSPFGDDYRMVEIFHRLGVRVAQLTYNIQNLAGGACYDEHDSGLTAFGRIMVAEMNRVGMLVDLSHVGNRTCLDAIDASEKPVAITHSNPTWFVDSPPQQAGRGHRCAGRPRRRDRLLPLPQRPRRGSHLQFRLRGHGRATRGPDRTRPRRDRE